MGLSPRKAEVLTEQGKGCELGQLAGNSIPSRMVDIVAAEAASRVAKFKWMLKARSEGGFVLMPLDAGLHSPDLHGTFIIILALNTQSVLLWHQCEVPGMVHACSEPAAGF